MISFIENLVIHGKTSDKTEGSSICKSEKKSSKKVAVSDSAVEALNGAVMPVDL